MDEVMRAYVVYRCNTCDIEHTSPGAPGFRQDGGEVGDRREHWCPGCGGFRMLEVVGWFEGNTMYWLEDAL